jgi:polysaccharide deacetylase 2 family uncharacterized protein YibQ
MHMDGSWIKSILKAFLALFQDISRSHFFFLDDGTFRKESRPDGRGKESLGNGDEIS